MEWPILKWVGNALEHSLWDRVRNVAQKCGNSDLVPMLNGPAGYMVAQNLSTYDFQEACPDCDELFQRPIQNIEECLQ
eukprot:5190865-Karenia_brevis.AAC.1